MKKYDVDVKRAVSGRETLPAGGYVCQIMSAKVEDADWGSTLVIAHDVCEGDSVGFFKRDYEQNDRENKKWRGIFRLKLPKEDGTEQDAWKKRALGNTIWAIEQSNPGFAWDWDEKKLKGKKIGLIYRNREWSYDGRTGWTTEAGAAESVENIQTGRFRPLKDKALYVRPDEGPTAFGSGAAEDEGDLPF